MVFSIGRVCIKLAGRDAGKTCVIIDIIDERTVLIDGQTRRRKVNVLHLEPTKTVLKVSKGVSREDLVAALEKEGISVGSASKPKRSAERPKKAKTVKTTKPVKPVKKSTTTAKKE